MRAGWLALALVACGPAAGTPASAPAASGSATAAAGSAVGAGQTVGIGRHSAAADYLNVDVPLVASSRDDQLTHHRGGTDVTLGARPALPFYNTAYPLDDGETAIAATYDHVIRIDLRTGKQRWQQPQEGYPDITVSPDGQHFVVSEDRRGLLLHSVKHGRLLAELALDDKHRDTRVAFDRAGKRLAYPDYQAGELVIVDVSKRRELFRLGGTGAAQSLAFSPDGSLLAAMHYGTLRVWDLASRRTRFVEKEDDWNVFAFSPTGDALWAGGAEGVIERVVPRYGQARQRFVLPGKPDVYDLVVVPSPEREVAFVRHAGPYLSLVDLAAGAELARLESGHDDIALSPKGRILVGSDGSATAAWTVPPAVQLPDKLPVPWRREPGHLDSVDAIAVGGGRVVTGCDDGTVILWDGATGKPLKRRFGHDRRIGAVAIAPAKGAVPHAVAFAAEGTGGVWLYDRDLEELLVHLALGEADQVHLAFDPTGERLLASRIGDGADRTEVLDLRTKTIEHTFKGVEWESFGFTSDGRFLFAGPDPAQLVDLDGKLRLRKSSYLPHGDYGESAVTILDDRYLVAAAAKERGSYLWLLGSEQREDERVSSPMVFSPGGAYFATTGEEGAPLVLSSVDGSVVKELSPAPKRRRQDGELERPYAQSIAISPDRTAVVAGFDDGVARLWRTRLGPKPTVGSKVLGVATTRHQLADLRSARRAVDADKLDVPTITEPLRSKGLSRASKLAVSPTGKHLAVWSGWGDAVVLEVATGKERRRFYGGGQDRVRHLSFGSGDRVVLARDRGGADLLSLADGKSLGRAQRGCRAAFEAPRDGIACIGRDTQLWRGGERVGKELKYAYPDETAATPDRKLLAYDSYGAIRLVMVDPDSLFDAGQITDHLTSVEGLAFSKDGRLLASVGSNVVLVHELGAPRHIRSGMPGRLRHVLEGLDRVSAVAISADGKRVAGAAGAEAWIWELPAAKVVARIQASVGIAEALAFAPDGILIALGGRGTLTWWRLP